MNFLTIYWISYDFIADGIKTKNRNISCLFATVRSSSLSFICLINKNLKTAKPWKPRDSFQTCKTQSWCRKVTKVYEKKKCVYAKSDLQNATGESKTASYSLIIQSVHLYTCVWGKWENVYSWVHNYILEISKVRLRKICASDAMGNPDWKKEQKPNYIQNLPLHCRSFGLIFCQKVSSIHVTWVLSMTSCSSGDRAPSRCSEGHLFDSLLGTQIFLFSTFVPCCSVHYSHFTAEVKIYHLYSFTTLSMSSTVLILAVWRTPLTFMYELS